MQVAKVIVILNALMFGVSWLVSLRHNLTLTVSVFAAAIGLLIWQIVLFLHGRRVGTTFEIQQRIRKHHYILVPAQTCLYVYWGLYWEEVGSRVLLIIVQIIFAYLVEGLLSWSRRKPWRLAFLPIPVTLSLNLFIWFNEEYFYFQLVMLFVAFLAKEFIQWRQDGELRHVFNPSGFALAATSVVLMSTGSIYMTGGLDFIVAFYLPPNLYEVLFLLGIVLQFFFPIVLITAGAALALSLLFFFFTSVLNLPLIPTPIDAAVFIGITLLATDPRTSPRTNVGRLLYGLVYGAGILATYVILRYIGQPTYYDKILMLVVVNLLVPLFDRVGDRVHGWLNNKGWVPRFPYYDPYLFMAAWVCLFLIIVPHLKRSVSLLKILPPPTTKVVVSARMKGLVFKHGILCNKYPAACKPFGFQDEIRYWKTYSRIDETDPASWSRELDR